MGLLLAAGVLLFVAVAARLYLRADPRVLVATLRNAGIVTLVLLAVGFAAAERFVVAILFAGLAYAAFTGGRLWPRGMSAPGSGAPPSSPAMSRDEALNVLGLSPGAGEDDIRAAHRRLIAQIHPDKGGSNYLAAKINEARDVLLS